MSTAFAVTWDYRCPFARNGHEHLVAGLEAGAPWEVEFVPFSLNQAHVAEGEPDVWDDPGKAPALLAMQVGLAVRDTWPDAFHRVHLALFAARHDEARDIREADVLRDVVKTQGLDPDAVFEEVDSGRPLATFRAAHQAAVADHQVFGVPTFIAGDQAVFVRVMHRLGEDREGGRRTIERILDLLTGWVDLNEFKRTTIPR
jgi:DSBA-like thioredoxin domain